MNFVRNLGEISKSDVAVAGGKGASLGELIHAGFTVPESFVIMSSAYDVYMKEGSSQIPESIKKEIEDNFEKLEAIHVAVRSSATAEDSATDAWAGQLETYLNTTREDLFENVKKCWDSLSSPRAIAYRHEKGLDNQKISVAVVVQKMILSESAGVAFSVHPVSQNTNEIIIEAVKGLGDKLVSGEVTPDSYTVSKAKKEIIENNGDHILKDEQILELMDIILKIEKHYGFPVDVEWAYDDDTFYILQSRPITTLTPENNIEEQETILSKFAPMEYWAEELAVPLYGITDILQPPCKDNFLAVYKDNVILFYFINSRHEHEAEIGHVYFKEKNSVQTYAELVHNILEKLELLNDKELSLMEVIEMSRECNGVYNMTEAFRFKKFEDLDDAETWSRFENIAVLRLEIRKKLEALYVQSDKAVGTLVKDHDITKNDLFFYTYGELQKLLQEKVTVSPDTILERQKGYVYWIKDGKSTLLVGTEATALSDTLHNLRTKNNINTLIGRVAYKGGIVFGKVQLILHNEKNISAQVENFIEGNILVTEMVRPESIIICRKAKAIVTDEGGIISHAAITSRELKIPCIIGTKIATKILKDGDMVEVDTDSGTVRLLK